MGVSQWFTRGRGQVWGFRREFPAAGSQPRPPPPPPGDRLGCAGRQGVGPRRRFIPAGQTVGEGDRPLALRLTAPDAAAVAAVWRLAA